LRIAGVRTVAAAKAADRLLVSTYSSTASEGGPYRERLNGSVPELVASLSAAAKAQAEADRNRVRDTRNLSKPRWFQRWWVQYVVLLWITPLTKLN
jgi:hypothetical protein